MKCRYSISRFLIFALFFLLVSCGGKGVSPTGPAPYAGPPCQDVLSYPQDLKPYAGKAGGSRPLLPEGEQLAAAEQQKKALFRPWRLVKPGAWVRKTLNSNFSLKAGNAFTDGKRPFPSDIWKSLIANSNKEAFGKQSGPGITLRHTNMRAMPTSMRFYLRPDLPGEGYPFDYFQLTAVEPGTPVYICNISQDGLWVLAEGPVTAGWMPAQDVAGVAQDFMERWMSRPLAALMKDHVRIGRIVGHVGTLLPLASEALPGVGKVLRVYYPLRGAAGQAEIAVAALSPDAAVAVPLPLAPDYVARVGDQLMGQAYGWGGLDEKRDCSALTRSLFAPFGLFLPRNSANQAKAGHIVSLTGLNADAKEAAIIRDGVPFRTLVWLPGHIGLYLGVYQGKAMMFHNMWGLRIKDASGGCDNRAIVGKAVVTTLRPGSERPDLCSPESFLNRIERATILFE